ncbi:MAG: Rid family hydrolase [Pseudomonadota bacterium]
MSMILHNPPGLFPPYANYSHAVQTTAGARMLFISGLNGYLADGKTMPAGFEEQGDLIWNHIGVLLRDAQMEIADLVSIRTYLADPSLDGANVRLRRKHLGEHRPASTVVCCRLLEPAWLLEVEAVAARHA